MGRPNSSDDVILVYKSCYSDHIYFWAYLIIAKLSYVSATFNRSIKHSLERILLTLFNIFFSQNSDKKGKYVRCSQKSYNFYTSHMTSDLIFQRMWNLVFSTTGKISARNTQTERSFSAISRFLTLWPVTMFVYLLLVCLFVVWRVPLMSNT